jgi:hypothetical protein
LKYNEEDYDTGIVHCRGRFDEDIQRIVPCSYTVRRSAAGRALPWYTEEPTEEEAEAMKQEREAARGELEGEVQFKDNPVAQELLTKAASMELDLMSNQGKRKAAADFVGLVDGKVDLPKNRDPKIEIGKLIMANQSKSPTEIMLTIMETYGFAVDKMEKAAAKEAAVESSIANPKNSALILAFKEVSGYYFKEQNRNAGATYVKAIETLKDLKEEVTAENAMSFSKGKTKLPGIGKGTAEKMKEFCETGTFAKLEEKRAAHA